MINLKLILFFIFSTVSAASNDLEDDYLNSMELDQFLGHFNLPKVAVPAEKKKRAEILKRNQHKVREANNAFQAGNQTWREAINEFSHLSEAEFLASHTGIVPFPSSLHTEEDSEELRPSSLPESYSSVRRKLVGPVKYQGSCGTCVLYATMALVEICHAKTFGHRAAYSEQQVMDCAYNGRDLGECSGAPYDGYARWLKNTRIPLVSEKTYPKPRKDGPSGHCYKNLKPMRPRVSVTEVFFSEITQYDGRRSLLASERQLKRLVYQRGAVATTLEATNIHHYRHGVFAGCPQKETYQKHHMVTVVGYGTEKGLDYWLIRNSWGETWGDHGYMKIQRGVGMCGIGGSLLSINCKPDYR